MIKRSILTGSAPVLLAIPCPVPPAGTPAVSGQGGGEWRGGCAIGIEIE